MCVSKTKQTVTFMVPTLSSNDLKVAEFLEEWKEKKKTKIKTS